MSEPKSAAETAFEEGLANIVALTDSNVDDSQKLAACQKAIQSYDKALSLGLAGRDAIMCRASLGSVYTELTVLNDQAMAVIENGLTNVSNAQKAVSELEKSIELDSQSDGILYKEFIQRAAYFPSIASVWLLEGRHRKNTRGIQESISYLESRVKLLDYLDGVHLPSLCFELGALYSEVPDNQTASMWYKRATVAEDFGDSNFLEAKQMAQDNLNVLSSPKAADSKKGCFIATAVYGTQDSTEVETLRQFRDRVLSSSGLGRILVSMYYRFSPPFADWLSTHNLFKFLTKMLLINPVFHLSRIILETRESHNNNKR